MHRVNNETRIASAQRTLITKDAEVARAEDFRSRESLGVNIPRRSIAELEAELITLGSRCLARWAPLQEWRADARHR